MFTAKLKDELAGNIGNRHTDNYDTRRYGPERVSSSRRLRRSLPRTGLYEQLLRFGSLDRLLLGRVGRCKLVAYRVLGHTRVKLPLSTPDYWNGIRAFQEFENKEELIEAQFLDGSVRLHLLDLNAFGVPVPTRRSVSGTTPTGTL